MLDMALMELNAILACLDWYFIAVIVLSGRAVTNWFGRGKVLPKQHIILIYASMVASIFLLARYADGQLHSKTWTCYLISYIVATSFYEIILKYIIDLFEAVIKSRFSKKP